MSITPDTKDWTWVLSRPCEDCRFDASLVRRDAVGHDIRESASRWIPLLANGAVAQRPRPDRWSVLEYGCHVRDVLGIFAKRLDLMLVEDEPAFENWDQDETALNERYHLQDPTIVSYELLAAADALATRYESVTDPQWDRPGTRSDGNRFTVETLAVYGLHDPIHHLWDVQAAQ